MRDRKANTLNCTKLHKIKRFSGIYINSSIDQYRTKMGGSIMNQPEIIFSSMEKNRKNAYVIKRLLNRTDQCQLVDRRSWH